MFSASSNVLDAKQEPETNSKKETVGEEHKGSSGHEDSPAARGSRLFTGGALSPSSFLPPSRNKLPDSLSFSFLLLGLHFHKVFRLIHSRVTRTRVKSVLFLVGS